MESTKTDETRDPELWELAQKRASFKKHLATYLVMNTFFWIVWYFTKQDSSGTFPWPVWPMFGWGIGLFFHYMGAYIKYKKNSVEREYEKLKNQRQG